MNFDAMQRGRKAAYRRFSATKVGISADVAKRFGQKVVHEHQLLYLIHIFDTFILQKEQKNMAD